jgi:hypothetical protein
MVGFYARFIPGYGEVAVVLYGLKKGFPLFGVRSIRLRSKPLSVLCVKPRCCRSRILLKKCY